MKCVFCGGETMKMSVTFNYDDEDGFFIVEQVPAEVCNHCGEKTYSIEVVDELLKFAKDKYKPVKKIEVPVFDYAITH